MAFEAPRSGDSADPPRPAENDGGRLSPFWRVFGGTLLRIAALVTVTLTQQFTSILTEVRQDLNRMHESRGELARKEEVNAALKDSQSAATSLGALLERSTLMEQQLKDGLEERNAMARAVRELRERLAEMAGRQSALSQAESGGVIRASR